MALAAGRIVLGVAPMVGAPLLARALNVPPGHDTPTARVFARLFGVRDIGLGVLVLAAVTDPVWFRFSLLFNALHDLGDTAVLAVPLVRRQGIDRTAGICLGFALTGGLLWLGTWLWAG